jgi:membrane-bound ClpP family serine protease
MTLYQRLRKILICIAGAALLLGGLYFLFAEAFLVTRIFSRIVILGLMLTMMGGYLLWAELVAPRLAAEKK